MHAYDSVKRALDFFTEMLLVGILVQLDGPCGDHGKGSFRDWPGRGFF